ncbi:DUF547 domain-containing protein [Winogradskyella aurantiaca]|uniref:DUF547 domain-containing protein n=1 Tax=Winogradskyella aurantiaca TaxID=2219558 RepID=UPI000E1D44CB|nr:DUF547 domain-containing protein [Winogradskyella aurantiaca]
MKSSVFLILALVGMSMVYAQTNHQLWSDVLESHVSNDGRVDYQVLKENPKPLIAYLNDLVQNQPNQRWSVEEEMAYWINAYNAYTIKLILDNYPLNSIRDIKQPWDKKFIPYKQKLISLNTIEHDILRKKGDPRIHFAIVCASVSCPNLSNKAFTSDDLSTQLDSVTAAFLNDDSKNKFENDKAELSKIFKWFSKDFKNSGGVIEFIKLYRDIEDIKKSDISYLNYNWDLND